jgi:hypothetical protein
LAERRRRRSIAKDFGLTWNATLEAGGLMVGEDISITLDLEFGKQA